MNWIKVPGSNKRHKVKIFTISHCIPCNKTKMFLEQNFIEYEYLNIDKANPEGRKEAMIEIGEYLPTMGVTLAYPIIIVDELSAIIGFDKWKLSKILEL